MSVLGGMFASAGSSFLNSMASGHGSTLGSRIMRPYQDFETPWGKGPYTGFAQYGLGWRVADAKAAGIHPLFALGNAGTGATVNMPHRPRAGGGGGGYSGGGGPSKSAEARAEEAHRQNMQRGHVELLKAQSDLRRMVQLENYKRPVLWPPGGQPGGEAITYPFGTKTAPRLVKRPLTVESRRSIPAFIEMSGPKGRRMIRNPEIGDELAEVDTAVRPWADVYDAYMGRKRFAPKYPVSKSGYYYYKQKIKRSNR